MNLLTLADWDAKQINEIIDFGIEIKQKPQKYKSTLKNKTLAMLFQKTSTRTRVSFETGMTQLGGHAIFLDWNATNLLLGRISDEIKCIERYANIIMARVYKHEDIQTMAKAATVPIINALCNQFHPCQILADLMTIKEKKKTLKGLKLAFVGDGNNVCNSLIIGCSKVGMKISVATPKNYKPLEKAVKIAKELNAFNWTENPGEAVKDADIVYTDTWVSMGDEAQKEERKKAFSPYQVNTKLMLGAKEDSLFMHCLPAHRGLEVTDSVIDSNQSIVFDQAENRMHAQKALMIKLLKEWK